MRYLTKRQKYAEGGEAKDGKEQPAFDQTNFDPFGGKSASRRNAERLRALRLAKRQQAAAGFKAAGAQLSDLSREYNRLTEDTSRQELGMAKGGEVKGAGAARYGMRGCKKY